MNFYTKKRRAPSINIVSLIDILAILLIFFIVTTTFKKTQTQFEINLPESKTATASTDEHADPIVLRVKSEDQITLDGKAIPAAELAAQLTQLHSAQPGRAIQMEADQSAPFGLIVKVIDALKQAGVKNIPAFTEPSKQPASP